MKEKKLDAHLINSGHKADLKEPSVKSVSSVNIDVRAPENISDL